MRHLCPRTNDHTGHRLEFTLTDKDRKKVTKGPGYKGIVTDLTTGIRWCIYGAVCSAGKDCYCDCIAKRAPPVLPPKKKKANKKCKRTNTT